MSIQQTDAAAAAVAKAPRVTLSDIEGEIFSQHHVRGHEAVAGRGVIYDADGNSDIEPLAALSLCILVMKNGFVVVGVSKPVMTENFNAELGRKFAYEDAIRQLWPLMGYALKDRLSKGV